MSNYKRPVIIWGNSFYINIELKQFNKDTSEYEYFDLTKCHDVKVNLICATHNTVIPLEWNLLDGYNYIIRCFVDYRLLHNTSYGIEVEGLNEDDIHWRWYMLPKEGILVVNNSSGLNIPDDVTTVDLAGRVGWGIQTDADLTNYYTKTEVNNLINESTDNSPYVLECWQEIDEDLRKTLAEYIQNSRDIILHEGDGADLKLFEYIIGGDNEVTYMAFHGNLGEEGTSEITQYFWRIPYEEQANNGWSISNIDFLTSSDRLEVTWDGVAISDGAEDPTYTYKIWGNHTWKEFIDIVNEGKTIQLAIHPESQNSIEHGYRGVPDYTVTLFTCFSAINVITTYFYAVLYNYFEWEGRVTSNGLYVYVLRVDPDKTEYPNDQTKWKIKLTEERIDTIEMQKKTDENTEQLDNIELNTNNNNLILQTTLDETPKVFSRVGMKTINNQSILGTGNIEIEGGGGEQVQSDWNETDTASPAYIQHKPDIQSIEGSIADVQNDIDNLEDDIAAQQAEISGVQTAISGHQTAIENQTNEISGIQSAVSGHQTAIENLDTEKQDVLESGVNIKTINNESILGEGNITIESGVEVEPAKIVVTDEEVSNPDPDAVYIVQKPIELKTINGEELVGEGNIEVEADTSEIEEQLSGMQTVLAGHQTAIENQATEISGMQTVLAGHQTAIENQSGVDPGFIKVTNPNNSNKVGLVSSLTTHYNTNIGKGAVIEGSSGGAFPIEASGNYSHAEGFDTRAQALCAHTEGEQTRADGNYSHAEGYRSTATGTYSHAEGWANTASGDCSHAEGNMTMANNYAEHVSGQYNSSPTVAPKLFNGSTTAIVSSIGNGSGMNSRHNAFEVRQNGDIYYADTEKIDGDTVHYYDAPMIKLQDAIGGVQTAISGHQTAIQNQATEISGIQTTIAGHQTAIQNQATEISGIQSNISGMQTEISGMQTSIAGHQTAIQNQATEISGMQTVLAGHQTALENQSGGGDPKYYVKLNWLSYPQDSSWQGNQAIEFKSLEVWDLTSSTQVYNAYFNLKDPAVVFSEITSQFAIRCSVKADNVSASVQNLTFTSWNGYRWLYVPQNVGSTILGNGSILQFDFYVTESSSSWTRTGICNTVTIPIGPCKNRMVTSTTSGLKIEVVSALPASPDANTIYIVQ